MAIVSKPVNRGIPASERTQNFTSADAIQGDILDIINSLGKAAHRVDIKSTSNIAIRINSYNTVFQRRGDAPTSGLFGVDQLDNTASGMTYTDTTVALLQIPANTTFTLDKELPIRNIELTTISGSFDIFVC